MAKLNWLIDNWLIDSASPDETARALLMQCDNDGQMAREYLSRAIADTKRSRGRPADRSYDALVMLACHLHRRDGISQRAALMQAAKNDETLVRRLSGRLDAHGVRTLAEFRALYPLGLRARIEKWSGDPGITVVVSALWFWELNAA